MFLWRVSALHLRSAGEVCSRIAAFDEVQDNLVMEFQKRSCTGNGDTICFESWIILLFFSEVSSIHSLGEAACGYQQNRTGLGLLLRFESSSLFSRNDIWEDLVY